MKILMVLHSHECGGVEKHALLLMRGLLERGHDAIFAGPYDSWMRQRCDESGIPVLHAPLRGTCDLFSTAKLAAYAKMKQIDLIHGHLSRGALYASLAGKWSGTPSVGTAHTTYGYHHYHRVDRLIAVSLAVKKLLMRNRIPPERISLIRNGVPSPRGLSMEERREIRKRIGLEEGNFALCMAARFDPVKGQDLAVEAFRRLNEPRSRLVFIGNAEGEWCERVKAQARSSGLERRTIFLGHRENMYELLGAMDLFLAPSRLEALSLSLLEALAIGLPIVASSVGGNPEVIANGENGLLVKSEDVEGLTEAIRRMIREPGEAEKMGRRGMQAYQREFTLSKMIDDTLGVYRELLGDSNR